MTKDDVSSCTYLYFGLLVTGEGERKYLHRLFRELTATGVGHFEVIRKIEQLTPRTSRQRRIEVVGTNQRIPTKDEERISLPARNFLQEKGPCSFALLIDDLEHDRRDQVQAVFERYRDALEQALDEEQKRRVAVHFLVTMLEAYFFADAQAVNQVLDCTPPLEDYPGDVEQIRHPKGELKRRCRGYSETETMGAILSLLDVSHVLARPDTCAALRALFDWCVCQMQTHTADILHISFDELRQRLHLDDGVLHPVTKHQCRHRALSPTP